MTRSSVRFGEPHGCHSYQRDRRFARLPFWAVGIYWFTFSLPLPLDLGLLVLAGLGCYSAVRLSVRIVPGMLVCLALLVGVVFMGNVLSIDGHRSWNLSLGLFPAVVVALLVSGYFRRSDLTGLIHILSAFTILVGGWLLTVAAVHPDMSPEAWIAVSALTAFKVPNDVALFPIFFPLFLGLWRTENRLAVRVPTLIAIVITLVLGVVYRSRLAMLVSLVSAALFYWHADTGKRFVSKLVLFLAMILVVDAITGFHALEKLRHPLSAATRLPLWIAAWRMFLDAPWHGHGVGSFRLLYQAYLQPLPDWVSVDSRLIPWSHNLYLELLAELGLPGILAFMAFFYFPLRAWLLSRRQGESQRILTHAFLCAFGGFCLGGFFEFSLWRQWVGLTFLFLVACMVSITNKNLEG